MDWKQCVFEMYFGKHMEIVDISRAVGRSRQHVSRYLRQFTQFAVEKEWRKKQNRIKRNESKKQWDREHRKRFTVPAVDSESLRREHDEAVRVLSHEKY